jgi:hypothetical protein
MPLKALNCFRALTEFVRVKKHCVRVCKRRCAHTGWQNTVCHNYCTLLRPDFAKTSALVIVLITIFVANGAIIFDLLFASTP